MRAELTEKEYNKSLKSITNDPYWKYAETPSISLMGDFLASKTIPWQAKAGLATLGYAGQIVPYLISTPVAVTLGGLEVVTGLSSIEKGRTGKGVMEVVGGAATAVLPIAIKGVGKSATAPTKLTKVLTTAGAIGLPIGAGGLAAYGSYREFGSVPGAVGAFIGTAGAIGGTQLYRRESQYIPKTKTIKVEKIIPTGEVEGVLNRIPKYIIIGTKGEKITQPLTQVAYKELMRNGRMTLVYTRGQLDWKYVLDKLERGTEKGINLVTLNKYKTQLPRWVPEPKYSGIPTGGTVYYGFGAKKSRIISPEEASKTYNKALKKLVSQGMTIDKAKAVLKYTEPKDVLALTIKLEKPSLIPERAGFQTTGPEGLELQTTQRISAGKTPKTKVEKTLILKETK
jgi:hypothetical protein